MAAQPIGPNKKIDSCTNKFKTSKLRGGLFENHEKACQAYVLGTKRCAVLHGNKEDMMWHTASHIAV